MSGNESYSNRLRVWPWAKGRLARLEFFGLGIILGMVWVPISILIRLSLDDSLAQHNNTRLIWTVMMTIIAAIACLYVLSVLDVARVHDMNRNGFWSIPHVVATWALFLWFQLHTLCYLMIGKENRRDAESIEGQIVVILLVINTVWGTVLLLKSGTKSANRFGAPPVYATSGRTPKSFRT